MSRRAVSSWSVPELDQDATRGATRATPGDSKCCHRLCGGIYNWK